MMTSSAWTELTVNVPDVQREPTRRVQLRHVGSEVYDALRDALWAAAAYDLVTAVMGDPYRPHDPCDVSLAGMQRVHELVENPPPATPLLRDAITLARAARMRAQ